MTTYIATLPIAYSGTVYPAGTPIPVGAPPAPWHALALAIRDGWAVPVVDDQPQAATEPPPTNPPKRARR